MKNQQDHFKGFENLSQRPSFSFGDIESFRKQFNTARIIAETASQKKFESLLNDVYLINSVRK